MNVCVLTACFTYLVLLNADSQIGTSRQETELFLGNLTIP